MKERHGARWQRAASAGYDGGQDDAPAQRNTGQIRRQGNRHIRFHRNGATPVGDQVEGIYGAQAGHQIIAARCRVANEVGRADSYPTRTGIDHVGTCRDVVKGNRRAHRHRIEAGIHVAHARRRLQAIHHLVLIEQGQHPGESRGPGGSSADDLKAAIPVNQVAGTLCRSRERDIGHIPEVVIGNAGAGLPGGLRKEGADTASRGGEISGCRVVPGSLWNVRKDRGLVRVVDGIPVSAGSFGEGGAADSGDFRNTRRSVHCQFRHGSGSAGETVGSPAVPGSRNPGNPL